MWACGWNANGLLRRNSCPHPSHLPCCALGCVHVSFTVQPECARQGHPEGTPVGPIAARGAGVSNRHTQRSCAVCALPVVPVYYGGPLLRTPWSGHSRAMSRPAPAQRGSACRCMYYFALDARLCACLCVWWGTPSARARRGGEGWSGWSGWGVWEGEGGGGGGEGGG